MYYHQFFFFARKPAVSTEYFHYHYLIKHPRAGRRIPYLRRYIQNHRIHSLDGDSQFDAVSEIWNEELVSVSHSKNDPGTQDRLIDEELFMDPPRRERLAGIDRVIVDGQLSSEMVQGIFSIKRKYGWSLEEFRSHWIDRHAQIGKILPGIVHYQQCVVVDEAYEYGEPRTDGVEEIWFADPSSARKAIQSVEWSRSYWPSLTAFSDPTSRFFAESHLMMWPGQPKDMMFKNVERRAEKGFSNLYAPIP